ncbi:MAG: short-chain fatty acid transporter [Sporomusaceae bacterium]|nr:short-chain fatty acid transporter [Sporomusaceae bacterium]
MFKKFTLLCVKLVQRYLPDPFIFCAALTVFVFVLGIIITGQSPFAMITHWGKGFWSLLAFSMQMALVLVFGHTLANAPAFKKFLSRLAELPKSPKQAIIYVSVVAVVACWINWGFGLVIGAIYAREIAKKVPNVDYRLLIASAYSGFLIWHQGMSGSIPLTIASGSAEVKALTLGVIDSAIPTSLTIFHPAVLFTSLAFLLALPLINMAMHPDAKNTVSFVPVDPDLTEEVKQELTAADKMERGPLFSILITVMGFVYIIMYFAKNGFALNLDIVNFTFLILGVALHKTPRRFLDALAEAVKGAGGVLLQFPFYAGIAAMMVGKSAAGESIAGIFSIGFVSISTEFTFPLWAFLSAGLVNFFVPSGGGQWVVQAPIILPAAQELGVHPAVASMCIAFGDAWTNMIQPFWALPALGIAGLGARDIMGYCIIDLLVAGIIMGVGITVYGVMM